MPNQINARRLFQQQRIYIYIYQGFLSQMLTIYSIFYSTLPLPLAHEHSDIYLQLCMWGDYHVFLIATLVFTRLLLDEIYHLIELLFDWLIDDAMFVCLLEELILRFVTTIWHGKLVHLNSHWLSPLYYKQTY